MSELVTQTEISVGDLGDSTPVPADRPEDAPENRLRFPVAFLRHAAGIHVRHPGLALPDDPEQLDQTGEDVQRLETGNHDRHMVTRHERLEDSPAGNRRSVTGGKKSLHPGLRHLGNDLHDRRDVLVGREDGEVFRQLAHGNRGGRHGGGFESGREKNHFLVRLPGQLDRL